MPQQQECKRNANHVVHLGKHVRYELTIEFIWIKLESIRPSSRLFNGINMQ